MAGFEGARQESIGVAIREWRPGKYLPLYLAGIAAGAGIGLGAAVLPTSNEAVPHQPAPIAAPVNNSVAADFPRLPFELPSMVTPAAPSAELALAGDVVPLPFEFQVAMGAIVLVPEPVAPAVDPIVPAAPEAAAPVLPAAAPAAPAVKPAAPAQPAQPAAQPAAPPAPVAQAPAPPAKPNFYVPEVSSGPATGLETALLALINQERANAGLAPYTLDSGLTKIARTRSRQLIDQGYFGHKDPYGYSMYVELLAHFGYTSYAWAGENLAMNNYSVEESPAVALRGLMNSPTHKANLLASDFSRIGVGEVTDGAGRHYFTMIFLS